MNNMDKARLIVDRLEYEGEDLSSEALCIVADALDEIDAANDPYMPTPEEWAAHPWAKFAATDDDGYLWLYDTRPDEGKTFCWWVLGEEAQLLKTTLPPADYRTTLRQHPEGI